MSQEKVVEEQEEGGKGPGWIVSFADLMSLLLVFFVLLLSFSEIDAVKYRALSDSFREAFGSKSVQDVFTNPRANQMLTDKTGGTTGALLDQMKSIIPQAFPGALPNKHDGEGFLIRIPGRLLFETGKAELRSAMKPKLKEMAELVKSRPNVTLQVDGHTDNVPIHNAQFRSNWELSAARALAVVHFLIDECGLSKNRLSAASFGESRPLVPNDNPENREKNRRVEFRFVELSE
jgi:chemotaxis protein MotB